MSQITAVAPAVSAPGRRLALFGAVLFSAVSLISSFLLFAIEPMVAKMLLPSYGGSPMVWNTAVLFFQITLLLGYAYAHFSQRRLGPRRQPLLHVVLIVLPLFVLPVSLPSWSVAPESAPQVLWLLGVLVVTVGGPFAVLATTGPLLQRWYSWSGLPRANDPYFLYAAGNVGSLLALAAYPFAIEPAADLRTQQAWWSGGYVLLIVLLVVCVILVRRMSVGFEAEDRAESEPIAWPRRLRWLALAFLPSSLMLGVTTHISTDIAPVPMIWVVPLAIYLVTFIVAFGDKKLGWTRLAVRAAVLLSLAAPWVALWSVKQSAFYAMGFDFLLLLVAGLACHGLLAADRPGPDRLTEFFLVVSAGGALGGIFNGLIAPVLFNWTAEYVLVACLLASLPLLRGKPLGKLIGGPLPRAEWWRRAFLWAICPLVFPALALSVGGTPGVALGLVLAVAWALAMGRFPRGLAVVGLASFVVIFALSMTASQFRTRTFYGEYTIHNQGGFRVFLHGHTIHGAQLLDPAQRSTPVTYYSRSGPVGDLFRAYGSADSVAVIGLGAGGIAAHGRPGQRMDFYEIDPEVVRLAEDTRYFTYLKDTPATVRTIVGDGRLQMAKAPDGGYGIIILDAFSSDAVPTHILTRQALELYTRKLRPGGLLVFNVTNRKLDLAPMLGATARAAGLTSLVAKDDGSKSLAAERSAWVAVARTDSDLQPLRALGGRWRDIPRGGPVWTDSYSSLARVLHLF